MQDYSKFHFRDQRPNERIYQVVRRHWFDIFLQYIPIILGVSLFTVFVITVPFLIPDLSDQSQNLLFFFETLFLLLLWIHASLIFVNYYLDVWIITDQRVVDIEQKALFVREVSELYYDKIQDVTTEVKGFFPTLLDYGDVYVQTAGEKERFQFRRIPDPYTVKDLVMKLQERQRVERMSELREIVDGQQ